MKRQSGEIACEASGFKLHTSHLKLVPCETKPICRGRLETGGRRREATARALCETKPNLGGMGDLERDEWDRPPEGPGARNKAKREELQV